MDHPVSVGFETECVLVGSRTPGDPSPLALRYFQELLLGPLAIESDRRVFWRLCGGYIELKDFLEFMSTPCSTVKGSIDSMLLACGLGRYVVRRAIENGEGHQLRALLCLADDLSGPAPYYATRGAASRSVGFHINVVNLIMSALDATSHALAGMACLLSEITGSGDFVRDARGRFIFWRDPRTAHVLGRDHPGRQFSKLLMKKPGAFGRLQITGLGFTFGACDLKIRLACFMAAALAAANGPLPWTLPIEALSAPPGSKICYVEDGENKCATKLDLLERFLVELAIPLCDTDAGLLAGIKEGTDLALLAVQTLRREAVADVAATIPLAWAVKYAAFARVCERPELATPVNKIGQGGPVVEELALIGALEGDFIDPDRIRQKLLDWAGLRIPKDSVWLSPVDPGLQSAQLPAGLSSAGWELAASCERRQTQISWSRLNRPLPSHLVSLGQSPGIMESWRR